MPSRKVGMIVGAVVTMWVAGMGPALACSAGSKTASTVHGELPASQAYFELYASQYTSYYDAVMADPGVPYERKLELIEQKAARIRSDISTEIESTYRAHRLSGEQRHSCTKGWSGGTKKCGTKCLVAPAGYFTTADAVSGTKANDRSWEYLEAGKGRPFKPLVSKNGRTVSLKLQKSGKGKKQRIFWATFRLTDQEVRARTATDVDVVMKQIRDLRA